MSVEKVRLPREVAEALDKRLALGHEPRLILSDALTTWEKVHPYEPIAKYAILNCNALLSALVNGYEVERTPEEELALFYTEISAYEAPLYGPEKLSSETVKKARLQAIRDTLNILNITIEGVNV